LLDGATVSKPFVFHPHQHPAAQSGKPAMRTDFVVPACLSWLVLTMLLGICATTSRPAAETDRGLRPPTPAVEQALQDILDKHRIVTAGLGILVDGKPARALYHGDASPGVPANAATRFNVASITKTVTAEAALRLIDAGELDLDEPLGAYWVDPDIAGDPRLLSLTARTVLTHTTGFPNWRFFRSDGKLAFVRTPGVWRQPVRYRLSGLIGAQQNPGGNACLRSAHRRMRRYVRRCADDGCRSDLALASKWTAAAGRTDHFAASQREVVRTPVYAGARATKPVAGGPDAVAVQGKASYRAALTRRAWWRAWGSCGVLSPATAPRLRAERS
jgi:CubicO group peptidase (beta-lactamase class C family)